ncbi:MAG: O-antigen ligase family protein [Erysipelotrichales bacterium]|nr:O-antigen ligase family protein [Erysipelotrichales bacterium]
MLFNILSVIAATRLIFFKQEDIKKSILLIGNVITISTILVSTYSIIYEYIYLMKFSRLGTYLFAGQYGTRMTYTYNLTISIFFLLFNILNNINKRKSIIYLFLILIFSILSGTRKLFLIMLVFVTFYYIFSKKVNPAFLIKTLIFGSIFLTISTVLMFNVPIFYEMFGSRVESLIIQIQTGEGDSSSWERNLMVKHGKKYFETNKMSGIGTNGFKYAFGLDTKIYKYSHNNYIEVAVNFGVKGLLLFYGGIIIILIRLLIYKRGNIDELRNLFISIILSLMVSDYYTVTYYQIHFLLIFILASFYSFNVNKRNKKNNVEV